MIREQMYTTVSKDFTFVTLEVPPSTTAFDGRLCQGQTMTIVSY